MRLALYALVLATAALTLSVAAAAAVRYTATTLSINGSAADVNDSRQVVGCFYDSARRNHAFFWSQSTGMIDLGLGYADGINSSGVVTGTALVGGVYEAFTWKLGESMNYLGRGSAYAINDSGLVAGWSPDGLTVWKPSGEHVIIQTAAGGYCLDINNVGVTTGYLNSPAYASYTWTEAGGVKLLPTPPSGEYDMAQCINDSGRIAGYKTGGPTWACMWQSSESSTQYLTRIGMNSAACGINNKGQIVGYYGSGYSACLWNTDGTVTDLHPATGAWRSQALAINDCGVVVGYSDYGSGTTEAVVIWDPVPEPSSVLSLAAGLLGLIGAVRLRRRE